MVHGVSEIVGQRKLAKEIGISRQTLSKIMGGQLRPIPSELATLITKTSLKIQSEANSKRMRIAALIAATKLEIDRIGLPELANKSNINPSNLKKAAKGDRALSPTMQIALQAYFKAKRSE
jgi:DNA-binding XRE family transcriptional regulator